MLTEFGRIFFGAVGVVLIMSGIYYWSQRAYRWLYQRQTSLEHMTHAELHACVAKVMSPPDVLLEGARLHSDLTDAAFIHNIRLSMMLESSICAYGGVDEKDAQYVATTISYAPRPQTIAHDEFDSETRRKLIATMKRILESRPQVDDDTAQLMKDWISILEAAERLEQHLLAHNTK